MKELEWVGFVISTVDKKKKHFLQRKEKNKAWSKLDACHYHKQIITITHQMMLDWHRRLSLNIQYVRSELRGNSIDQSMEKFIHSHVQAKSPVQYYRDLSGELWQVFGTMPATWTIWSGELKFCIWKAFCHSNMRLTDKYKINKYVLKRYHY